MSLRTAVLYSGHLYNRVMDEASFTMAVEHVADAHRATVVGEVDFMTAAELDDKLSSVFDLEGPQTVEVDLSQVSFIDSTGMAALAHLHFLAAERGSRLVLLNPSTRVLRLFELTNLEEFFEIRAEPPAGAEPPTTN